LSKLCTKNRGVCRPCSYPTSEGTPDSSSYIIAQFFRPLHRSPDSDNLHLACRDLSSLFGDLAQRPSCSSWLASMRREIGTHTSSAEHAHNRDRSVLSDSALRWAARRGACPYRPGCNWPRRRPILRWLGAHMFCTRWSSFSTTWLRFPARIRSVSKCRRAWEEEKEVRRPETGGVRFDPGEIGRIRISAVTAWAWRLQNVFRTFSGFSKDSDLVDHSCSRHFWGGSP
jgi:hypothetical protein